jgi:hypothetical protein
MALRWSRALIGWGLTLAVVAGGCTSWRATRACEAQWERMLERSDTTDPFTRALIREGEALAKAEFLNECVRVRR